MASITCVKVKTVRGYCSIQCTFHASNKKCPEIVYRSDDTLFVYSDTRSSSKDPEFIESLFKQITHKHREHVLHNAWFEWCILVQQFPHWENGWSESPILGFTGSCMYLPFFSVPRVLAHSLRLEIVFLVFLKDNDVLQVMCGTNQ